MEHRFERLTAVSGGLIEELGQNSGTINFLDIMFVNFKIIFHIFIPDGCQDLSELNHFIWNICCSVESLFG